ncbi:MAG: hypothetical protein JJE39_05510 [Vicinamibacteria bacterium]|nr:hypothetical protein [Vicinamibacteria bacterium]
MSEYRTVRDHAPSCSHCTLRLSQFRLVNQAASRVLAVPAPRLQPVRLVASLSVAAALVASLATSLLLVPKAPQGPRPSLPPSAAPSDNLSAFYETVSPVEGRR